MEETEGHSPAACSLVYWTEGFLFCGGYCTLARLLKKKMTSALFYTLPGDQISQQDKRVFSPSDLTSERNKFP